MRTPTSLLARNSLVILTSIIFALIWILPNALGDENGGARGIPQRKSLTFSIAPDGTQVGRNTNSIAKFASQFMSEKEFYFLVQEAFQEWSKHVNLTIGLVHDEGRPFGSPGLHYDDPRFGDIRVGAIPMPPDTLGLGMDHRSAESGTWAGTLLLNAKGIFRDRDHVYQVLLHEAGHVLGLPHNDLADSVMNPDAHLAVLSTYDIASIQAIYGQRSLDPNEHENENNDSVSNPTRLRVHGSDAGTIPAMAFGDLGKTLDEDWFEMDVLNDYDGKVTIALKVSGLSMVACTVEVYDENLVMIGEAESRPGDNLSLTFAAATIGETAYIRILSESTVFDRGLYCLFGRFEHQLTVPQEKIDKASKARNLHWDQGDMRDFFREEGHYFFHPDDHLNDSIATAWELPESPLLPGNFETHESIFDAVDKDFFHVDAPDETGKQVMTIGLTSIDFGEMIPYISVYDENGRKLRQTVFANGNGTWVSQLTVNPNRRYFVSVEGGVNSSSGFQVGNYQLNVTWHLSPIDVQLFAKGSLTDSMVNHSHTVHVAKSQMFHLNLQASSKSAAQKKEATIWATIYDEIDQPVFQIATRPGETRSNGSVLLGPGSYRVQFDLTYDGLIGNLEYRLNGLPNSKSEGPELLDPSSSPFPPCGENQTGYCYPDNNESQDPFIWIDGVSSNLPSDPFPPPGWKNTDELYWPEVTIA